MIHDLLSFEAYFVEKYLNLFGIQSVVVGGFEDINEVQKTILRYPLLFVELPTETLGIDGDSVFKTRLLCLVNGTNIPRIQYKTNLNDMRRLLIQVLKEMENDSPHSLIFCLKNIPIEPKERYTGDNLHGVFADISFTGIHLCE